MSESTLPENPDDNDITAEDGKAERIAKRIARSGVCSRRDAERMIEEGRVKLNGKRLDSPAVTVSDGDEILVDDKPLPEKEKPRLWRLFKKRGLVTSHRDEQGRDTVFEHLPHYVPRVISVGRLDLNSEGLLLLTNDGELARYLELPSTGWARRYRVRVHGRIEEEKLKQLEAGVTVDGIHYGSIQAEIDVQKGANAWLTVTLREGKNREIRRVMEYLGWPVTRLMRISYGPFQLGNLAPGDCEEITGKVMKEQLAAFFKGDYSRVSEKKSVAKTGTGRPKAPRTVFGKPASPRRRPQGGPAMAQNTDENTRDGGNERGNARPFDRDTKSRNTRFDRDSSARGGDSRGGRGDGRSNTRDTDGRASDNRGNFRSERPNNRFGNDRDATGNSRENRGRYTRNDDGRERDHDRDQDQNRGRHNNRDGERVTGRDTARDNGRDAGRGNPRDARNGRDTRDTRNDSRDNSRGGERNFGRDNRNENGRGGSRDFGASKPSHSGGRDQENGRNPRRENNGDARNDGRSNSRFDNRTDNRGENRNENRGNNRNDSRNNTRDDNHADNRADNRPTNKGRGRYGAGGKAGAGNDHGGRSGGAGNSGNRPTARKPLAGGAGKPGKPRGRKD